MPSFGSASFKSFGPFFSFSFDFYTIANVETKWGGDLVKCSNARTVEQDWVRIS